VCGSDWQVSRSCGVIDIEYISNGAITFTHERYQYGVPESFRERSKALRLRIAGCPERSAGQGAFAEKEAPMKMPP
jgi:hypothetical protein